MISKNNFYITVCEPYVTKIQSDMIVVLKAYEISVDDHEKMNNELIRHRMRFEGRKLKIDSLENEIVIAKDEYIILSDKYALSLSETNVLVFDNMCLNATIDKLHKSIDMIQAHEHMNHNFHYPWSKHLSLGSEFPKPVVTPLKEL